MSTDATPPPSTRPWLILALLLGGQFMVVLDVAIVNVEPVNILYVALNPHEASGGVDESLAVLDISVEGLDSLIRLADPVGATLSATELDEGLELYKVSCPIGVIGVIFESRPDALVQISCLCLKSGNAVLLKGGSEAVETNRILADIINRAGVQGGIPVGWLALLETRTDVAEMLKMGISGWTCRMLC